MYPTPPYLFPGGEIGSVSAHAIKRENGAVRSAMRYLPIQLRLMFLLIMACGVSPACRGAEIIRLDDSGSMFEKIPHFLLKGEIKEGDAARIDQAIPTTPDPNDGGSNDG